MEQHTKIPVKAIVRINTDDNVSTIVNLELPVKPVAGDKIKFGHSNLSEDQLNYFVRAISDHEDLLKNSPLGKFLGTEATGWAWYERVRVAIRAARWIVIDTVITPDYIIVEALLDDIYMRDEL